MTSSAWLAIGAIVASLLGPGLRPETLVLLGTALAVAVAGVRVEHGPERRPRWLMAIVPAAIGAIAIAVRIATGAASTPAVDRDLPAGSGPWSAVVVAVSSPRDGAQVATLRLDASTTDLSAGPGRFQELVVAATLPRFPDVQPGDHVRIDGRIQAAPDGPYGEYLAR